jgi:hypothetical protein
LAEWTGNGLFPLYNTQGPLELIEQTFPNLIDLELKLEDRVYRDIEVSQIPKLSCLQRLRVESHSHKGVSSAWFCTAMKHLRYLEIQSSTQVSISLNGLRYLAVCCPNLRTLIVGRIGKYLNADRLKQILSFFSSQRMERLEFNWNTSHPVLNDSVFEDLSGYQWLKRLSFWNRSPSATAITDLSIQHIVARCPLLEELHLFGGTGITENCVKHLENFTRVCLDGCPKSVQNLLSSTGIDTDVSNFGELFATSNQRLVPARNHLRLSGQ